MLNYRAMRYEFPLARYFSDIADRFPAKRYNNIFACLVKNLSYQYTVVMPAHGFAKIFNSAGEAVVAASGLFCLLRIR